MYNKNIIIGGSSLVGSYLSKRLLKNYRTTVQTYNSNKITIDNVRGSAFKVPLPNKDLLSNLFKAVCPSHVFIPASLTDVNYCEDHPEESYAINVKAVKDIAELCDDFNTTLVYFSSDYVFGSDHPSSTEEIPNPLNVYGKHKLLAEHIVLSLPKSLVFRTSSLFGKHPLNKNFLARTLNKIKMENLSSVDVIKGQIDTPTYAGFLSDYVVDIIESIEASYLEEDSPQDYKGITKRVFHCCGDRSMSRAEFLSDVFKRLELNVQINEIEGTSSVKRPNGGLIGFHYKDRDIYRSMITEFLAELD